MLRRRQRKSVFENMIRFGETFVDIAAVEPEVRADVGAFHRFELGKISETGARQFDRFVNQDCTGLQRLVNI